MDEFDERMGRVAETLRGDAAEIARQERMTREARELSAARAAKFIKKMRENNVGTLPIYAREIAPQGWHSPTDTNRLPRTTGYVMLGGGWVVRERIPSGDDLVSGLFVAENGLVGDCTDVQQQPPRDANPSAFTGGEYILSTQFQTQGKPFEGASTVHSIFATEAGYDMLALAAVRLQR